MVNVNCSPSKRVVLRLGSGGGGQKLPQQCRYRKPSFVWRVTETLMCSCGNCYISKSVASSCPRLISGPISRTGNKFLLNPGSLAGPGSRRPASVRPCCLCYIHDLTFDLEASIHNYPTYGSNQIKVQYIQEVFTNKVLP